MVSPAVNVVRYSALVTGIFYGVLHRRTLQAKYESSSAAAEVKKREHWLADAKKAWAQKQANNTGLITDPDAPGFDLEAVLKSLE
ncbi:hypothetical protein RQP46_010655 [Phenoliferia psychrophenolica]